jgi:hypothetical protein
MEQNNSTDDRRPSVFKYGEAAMKAKSDCFKEKHKQALRYALMQAGADTRVLSAINCIRSRVHEFEKSGARPSRCALVRLSSTFSLLDLSSNLRVGLEYLDQRTEKHIAEGIGLRFPKYRSPIARRKVGMEKLEDALFTNDQFCESLYYACDWIVEQIWQGKASHDEAVRKLARQVAADWKWATGVDLPELCEDSELWGYSAAAHPPNPLWIVLDSVKIKVGWETVKVLSNYALEKHPCAGGVGLWSR